MQVYDCDNLKDSDRKAKSFQEYHDYAGVDEGMTGVSTRFAFKILSKVFNFDSSEIAANPVDLMYVLEQKIEYGQNVFDRYVTYADFWIQDQEFRDHDTGESFARAALNAELEKIENPAGISGPEDFRNEIVNFVLRARVSNGGKNPL